MQKLDETPQSPTSPRSPYLSDDESLSIAPRVPPPTSLNLGQPPSGANGLTSPTTGLPLSKNAKKRLKKKAKEQLEKAKGKNGGDADVSFVID